MKKFAEETKVVESCLEKIQLIRSRSEFMRRLWDADRKLCVAATLRSGELADFLMGRIPADRLDEATAPASERGTRELAEAVMFRPGAREELLGILARLPLW